MEFLEIKRESFDVDCELYHQMYLDILLEAETLEGIDGVDRYILKKINVLHGLFFNEKLSTAVDNFFDNSETIQHF